VHPMPKQRDAAALRESIRSAAFTPATRDIGGLVELLGDDDDEVVRAAERAVARAAAGDRARVVRRLAADLGEASSRARRHGFRVLGRLAPTEADPARTLIAGLSDSDARVQRAAAHALGRLHASEAKDAIAAALLHAWDEAPELPLARAVAEAMGKLGLPQANGRLEAVRDGDAELARIARKAEAMLARDGSRGEESAIAGERAGDFDVDVVFSCRPGLERIVAEEVGEQCPSARSIERGPEGSGKVMFVWRGAPMALFAVRTMLGFGFALPPVPISGPGDLEAACVRALASEHARRIVETWTKGSVRYRIDWEGEGHKRGATWRVVDAARVQVRANGRPWVNDPTESTWQVSVSATPGAARVVLVPRKLADPRFAYRVRDVPAASHPTIAAALVRASRPQADDVVWDPFVGSGSELIERARAGPYRKLLGSDTDARALDAARANVEAASLPDVSLELGDATEHAPRGVTRILTNPPMGRRVARDGSLADLLDRFTDHAAHVVGRGGRLAWLSPLGARTAARAEANGFRVVLRQSVDMGGFHAELQVWEKP